MLYFVNDYSEGAHKNILKRLVETNDEKLSGYGSDMYCESAKDKIKAACHCPNGEVYFLTGGTQTNAIVIDAMLKSYEGVICAKSGHINVHEAGAIEFSGHKVLELPEHDGKVNANELAQYLYNFYADENHEHSVFPGMLYISHPTEYGTLYSKQELRELCEICHSYQIPMYMDGARLGYGLAAKETDVRLSDVAKYCDVFYIGGTKVGAFCGEAVVFTGKKIPSHFMTIIKQRGALLAKGRLLGIQFDALFTDNLYLEISKNAIRTAEILKQGFLEKGYTFYVDSPTNQIFVVLEDDKMKSLQKEVAFSFWEKTDETHTVVRFATSWATREEDVLELIDKL